MRGNSILELKIYQYYFQTHLLLKMHRADPGRPVKWQKNMTILFPLKVQRWTRGRIFIHHKYLHFLHLHFHDQGVYRCISFHIFKMETIISNIILSWFILEPSSCWQDDMLLGSLTLYVKEHSHQQLDNLLTVLGIVIALAVLLGIICTYFYHHVTS